MQWFLVFFGIIFCLSLRNNDGAVVIIVNVVEGNITMEIKYAISGHSVNGLWGLYYREYRYRLHRH